MRVPSRILASLFILLFVGFLGAREARADSLLAFTLTGPDGLNATFELPTDPTIDPMSADPGFGFCITPIDLVINGAPSDDFLAFYNTSGGGGFAGFSDDGWNFDFSLYGETLYGGDEYSPIFAPSNGPIELADEDGNGGYFLTMGPLNATPEPSSLLLILAGIVPLGLLAKRWL
jgi:hypothetical protein